MANSLTGLIAAPYTAMHDDGSLNLSMIERQAHSLIASGVSGAFVCGTTGEYTSLTLAERLQVAEQWAAVARSDLRLIVHVGHNCLADARTLAAHAQRIEADGIGATAPNYFKPAHVDDLVAFCGEVAAAAPSLPFYYYHIPSMTGVNLSPLEFLKRGADRIPSLGGVKFTDENLFEYGECLAWSARSGRFDILFGRDEILLGALALGAVGAVGSTYNFAAPLYLRMMAALRAGNLADAQFLQAQARQMVAAFLKRGGLPAGKAIMKMIGLDCGPVRLPLRTLSPEDVASLQRDLDEIGFFAFASSF